MKHILLITLSILMIGTLHSQDISSQFTTSHYSSKLIIKSEIETDFDYCIDGTIMLYHPDTGELIEERGYNGAKMDGYNIDLYKFSPNGRKVSFNIYLANCSDDYVRLITSDGYETIKTPSGNEKSKLSSANRITLALSPGVQSYYDRIMTATRKREAKEKAELELMERNKKQVINVGDVCYVCNFGTTCEAIVREIASSKVRVEFIEQCHAYDPPRISSIYYLNAGKQKWIDKQFIHKEKVECYKYKSAF